MSLVVSALAPVIDARLSVTPQLNIGGSNCLVLIDLGRGACRLGGSALAQVCGQLGDESPDMHSAADLKAFFVLVQELLAAKKYSGIPRSFRWWTDNHVGRNGVCRPLRA